MNQPPRDIIINGIRIPFLDCIGVILIFLYIFSFYVLGPITSSIVAALLVSPYLLVSQYSPKIIFESRYFCGILGFIILLLTLCVLYSTLHFTFDYSYFKTIFAQLIHLICGGIILFYLYDKYDVTVDQIIKWIIIAYIAQSIIEVIVISIPGMGKMMLYFNHADRDQEFTKGVRGIALSASTTWGLGLTYGIVFIIYFGLVLSKRISFKTTCGFLLLIIGTIFAGRTGFVGAIIGIIYFSLFTRQSLKQKFKFIFIIVLIIIGIITIAFILAPKFVENMLLNVLPWAFEPIYNYIENGQVSTTSTNRLSEMWEVIPTFEEILLGTGHFTNIDGSYYNHVDVGFLRNLFYWGIGGYSCLIFYHLYIMWPMLKDQKYRLLWCFILLYLLIAEYKAMTLGLNKLSISVLYLISFSEYLNSKRSIRLTATDTNYKTSA